MSIIERRSSLLLVFVFVSADASFPKIFSFMIQGSSLPKNLRKSYSSLPENWGEVLDLPINFDFSAENREKFVPVGRLLLPSRPLACSLWHQQFPPSFHEILYLLCIFGMVKMIYYQTKRKKSNLVSSVKNMNTVGREGHTKYVQS